MALPAAAHPVSLESADDIALADRLSAARTRILAELRKRIIGQDEVIEQALIAIIAGGNCLLVGVPGLAKTLMVSSVSQILSTTFKRVQFTPDLMPSDITGTTVLEEAEGGKREFRFVRGSQDQAVAILQASQLRSH